MVCNWPITKYKNSNMQIDNDRDIKVLFNFVSQKTIDGVILGGKIYHLPGKDSSHVSLTWKTILMASHFPPLMCHILMKIFTLKDYYWRNDFLIVFHKYHLSNFIDIENLFVLFYFERNTMIFFILYMSSQNNVMH